MSDVQSYELKPGDKITFHNREKKSIRVKVVTACGTMTEAELHVGAIFKMTVGNQKADVYILDAEEVFNGIRIVRREKN
jgi:hypothetical protein